MGGRTPKPLPSVERLRELFDYSSETGEFIWQVKKGRIQAGSVAGHQSGGYWYIRVDMEKFLAHRLVWKFVHGADPAVIIDHINGNPLDNRIANLREADYSENLFNMRNRHVDLPKGVSLIKQKDRIAFAVQVCVRGARHFVGNFGTSEEAGAAYAAKAAELHGEFSNAG